MVQARIEMDDYTSRVLDVVKGKHGLKNKQEALKKFVEIHGEEYVEKEPNEHFLRELDEKYEAHIKKYGFKKMKEKELDEILNL